MLVKLLNQRNPAHDADRLAQYAALYEGGKCWEDLVQTWLPQYPEETPANYEHRKTRALYHNHAGPIIDTISAGLFSQSPAYDDYDHEWFDDFTENCDRDGTSLDLWFKRWMTSALRDKHAFCWVNLPARDPHVVFESRADEEAAGALDAFLVPLRAEQVIDWDRNENGKLKWLLVHDVVSERNGLEAKRVCKHRWTYIDALVIRRFEWEEREGRKDPTAEDDAVELPAVLHGLGEVPVIDLRLPDGLHAMGKLHHPALAHLRARNDLSWAMHRANHPLLVIKQKWEPDKPVLGAGRYLHVGEEGEVSFIGPDSGSFQISAEDVKALREEMYRVVQQMAIGADSDANRSKMSGESKSADWRALEIVLSSLAEIVKPAMADVLRLVAKARGVKDAEPPTIGGLEGWEQEDLEVWLTAAASALDAAQLSPTFRKEVAKRQARRLLTDASAQTMQTIEGEIDSASMDDPSPYLPPKPEPPEDGPPA